MARLIDTSLWIDYTRRSTPDARRDLIASQIENEQACLAEPIIFELTRSVGENTLRLMENVLKNFPVLPTPPDLWKSASRMGQACRRKGIGAGAMDLLIAAVALHHNATLVTLDADFAAIGQAWGVKVDLIKQKTRGVD